MRRPRDPQLFAVWCLVAAIGIIGVAVAFATINWGHG